MTTKAIIISISTTKLKSQEIDILKNYKPWGIILFKRNIKSFNQTKKLVFDIKKAAGNKNYPILIDEEGGDVTRISNFIHNNFYQKLFGDIYKINAKSSKNLYENYLSSLCMILKDLGININTIPVLDLIQKNTHKIILKRAYSSDIEIIKSLGDLCIRVCKKNKISTVIKHIPGHGPAQKDSHLNLPIIKKSFSNLNNSDFNCFKNMNSHFAMTAHVIYHHLDKKNPVTFSNKIINQIIRKKINFKGILISDDISMKALKFDLLTNALKSLEAGCNLALYCGGNFKESKNLVKRMPYIDNFTQKKTSEFYNFLR